MRSKARLGYAKKKKKMAGAARDFCRLRRNLHSKDSISISVTSVTSSHEYCWGIVNSPDGHEPSRIAGGLTYSCDVLKVLSGMLSTMWKARNSSRGFPANGLYTRYVCRVRKYTGEKDVTR